MYTVTAFVPTSKDMKLASALVLSALSWVTQMPSASSDGTFVSENPVSL